LEKENLQLVTEQVFRTIGYDDAVMWIRFETKREVKKERDERRDG
jgi:hypothetical protein